MGMLLIRVVEPTLEREADDAFRTWCAEHQELMETMSDDSVTVSMIRGTDSDGRTCAKREYRITIDDSFAALLVAEREHLLDVTVVEPKNPNDADHEFQQWWRARPKLVHLLGEDGYIVDDLSFPAVGRPMRQYRVRIRQADAEALVA